MNYIEAKIQFTPYAEAYADVVASLLAELGYDSFSNDGDALLAYCPENTFDNEALLQTLDSLPLPNVMMQVSHQIVETQDWNAEWESQQTFVPIIIDNRCVIHAPDNKDVPVCKYDVLIAPKMSFGSGHHETTSQILAEIIDLPLQSASVLDMGCGTAVLGLLAAKCGAKAVRAIDIDDWVCDNARENVELNGLSDIVTVDCGDASSLETQPVYDCVLANINRNILLADMNRYNSCLKVGGTLLMSGFYEEDVPAIRACAEALGLTYRYHHSRNNWVVIRFEK